jgi:hypothetical protein
MKDKITEAFLKSSGRPAATPEMEQLSEGLAKAVEEFVSEQEFRVVKLESELDVEHIKTSGDIDVDVKPDTLFGPYAPLLSSLKKLASLVPGAGSIIQKVESVIRGATKKVSAGGSTLPKIDWKKSFGQGGALDVKGIGKIEQKNYKTADKSEGLTQKSVVKLFPGEIKNGSKK